MENPNINLGYNPTPRSHIDDCIARLLAMANAAGAPRMTEFDATVVTANPGDTEDGIRAVWAAASKAQHFAWLASPEGQKSQQESARLNALRERAATEPIREFACIDPGAWAEGLANNQEYGLGIMKYAARWANMAEAVQPITRESVKAASYAADWEGMCGESVGFARILLKKCWLHKGLL